MCHPAAAEMHYVNYMPAPHNSSCFKLQSDDKLAHQKRAPRTVYFFWVQTECACTAATTLYSMKAYSVHEEQHWQTVHTW